MSYWTESERDYLIRNVSLPVHEQAAKLGRSPMSVSCQRVRMGLAETRRPWTRAEDRYLAAYAGDSIAAVGAALGRSRNAVVCRRRALGIAPNQRSDPWTQWEDDYLRRWTAKGDSVTELASALERSRGSVHRRQRTLGIGPGRNDGTAAEIRKLISLHGKPIAEQAAKLGRSRTWVVEHRKRLGLSERRAAR